MDYAAGSGFIHGADAARSLLQLSLDPPRLYLRLEERRRQIRCLGICDPSGSGDQCKREQGLCEVLRDRKSTRLNSSHANISYAVFCLKKKKKKNKAQTIST